MKRRNPPANSTPGSLPVPSPGAIKLLQRLAKGSKGDTPPSRDVLEIVPLLGWTTTVTTHSCSLWDAACCPDGVRKRVFAEIVRAIRPTADSVDRGRGVGLAIRRSPTHTPDHVEDRLRKEFLVLARGEDFPTSTATGHIVLLEAYTSWMDTNVVFVDGAWVGIPTRRIESPVMAKPLLLQQEFTYDSNGSVELGYFDTTGFWNWAYKAGAKDSAAAVLASFNPIEVGIRTRTENDPTPDHMGTCQICGRTQKLRDYDTTSPRLVDHGYVHENRGGRMHYAYDYGELGKRYGHCYGCGWEPWEIGSAGLSSYLKHVVIPTLARETEDLRALQAGEVRSIDVDEQVVEDYRVKVVRVTYRHGDNGWERILRSAIKETQMHVDGLTREVANIRQLIAGWTRQPLYDEIARERGIAVQEKPKRRGRR